MFKGILAVAAIAMAAALVPSAASASTAVPALHTGDTQAYALDSSGNHLAADVTATVTGVLTLHGAADVTCNSSFTVVAYVDGTTSVTTPSVFTGCTTNIPGCSVAAVPNVDFGDRFVLDSNGDFRDRVNVSITNTYSGSCPFGPIAYTGELSPLVGVDPVTGALYATFDSTNAGTLSSAIGTASATGTLTETGTLFGFGGFGT